MQLLVGNSKRVYERIPNKVFAQLLLVSGINLVVLLICAFISMDRLPSLFAQCNEKQYSFLTGGNLMKPNCLAEQGVTNFVFLGEAGCGKSEISLNVAIMLGKAQENLYTSLILI